ncbi:MAG: Hsp20/alpha crystallin family protein [Beijerinckiaceae bacterium]
MAASATAIFCVDSPVYTEYNIGHLRRSFSLAPNSVDQEKIMVEMKDGVLTLTLPKAEQAERRRIKVEWV